MPTLVNAERRCAALTPCHVGTLLNSLLYIQQQFPTWSRCAPGTTICQAYCTCVLLIGAF